MLIYVGTLSRVLKKSLAGGTACPTLLQVLDLQWWRGRFRLRFGGAEDLFSTLLESEAARIN
jgi:hypothetical protein